MLGANSLARNAAARFGLPDQLLHHLVDVLNVQTRAVKRAVGGDGAEHLADGPEPALVGGFRAFHHQRRRAHAHDHAVPPAVEWNGGIFDRIIGRRGAAGQEARAEPLDEMVGGDIVGGDDHHPAASPRADPILRQRRRP